jgi:hypothetical protein
LCFFSLTGAGCHADRLGCATRPWSPTNQTKEDAIMALLSDWNGHQKELEDALKAVLQSGQAPPKDVLLLLKTEDLKAALKLADDAKQTGDIDGIRAAQAKTQKFFMKYANQFKAAKMTTQNDDALSDLNDCLNMFNVYMTRTQKAVALQATTMIKDAKAAATKPEEVLELDIKAALSPLKFKSDWKGGKTDFETSTGKKKPSEKVLVAFRKSSSLENSLGSLDKACEGADPKAYRKAFNDFVAASSGYASILEKALAGDKAADPIYKKKCEGLKELLTSIETRAKEKVKLLDDLGV